VPGIGAHTYKAVFVSTSANTGSSSAAAQLTVTASLPTTTTLAQSGTVGNYALTATVVGQGAVAPSGNVSFIDTTAGNSVLTSAAAVSSSVTLIENSAQTIPTGTYPAYMVSGDFNRDGIPDLAVANTGTSTVSILLGSSKGTFAAGTVLQIGAAPGPIAVGDFNRDGNIDLAVIVPTNATVSIFFGNGDGTFTAGTTPVYTPPQPSGIVVADVNGDGLLDLAVPSKTSNSVTILLGHGDGTFTPAPFSSATGNSPQSIVQADFNGDGVIDLAITNNWYAGTVTILMGNGDGSFTIAPALSTTANPYSIAVGDFNQDGKPDLAIGANGGTAVNIFLGNGDGTFKAAASALTTGYAFSFAIADINGDNKPDLIVADANGNKLTTLLGKGDGTFTTGAVNTVTAQPEAVVVGDWNGDGAQDIAVVNYYGSSVTTVMTQLTQQVTATANNVSTYGTGQHTIKAIYPGDTSYAGSTSGTQTITASNKSIPTITWATPLTITYGTPLRSTQLNATSSTSGTFSYIPAAGTVLSAGQHTLSVTFTPSDANYQSTTSSVPLTILQVPATTTFALSNQNLTFTATVTSTSSGTPTGSVIFYAGQTQIGSGTLSGGTASTTLASFPAGNGSLSAQYGGDINFTASTSASIPVLTLTAASTSLTVQASGTVTDNFSVAVPSGYTGTVQFSCTGLPQNTNCSFQPASVTFSDGTATANTVLTLTASGTARMNSVPFGSTGNHAVHWAAVFALPGLLPLLVAQRRRRLRERLRAISLLLLVCSASAWFSGCGGSGKSSSSVTSPGNYTIQVIASAPSGVSQSTAVTVTVR